jgi:3-oxoacyl-[acyl-carrier-protein] synthase II
MDIYIRAASALSPQKTFGRAPIHATPDQTPSSEVLAFLADPVVAAGNRLTCIEPDYRGRVDPALIRRMSRIIKMGVATAGECLHEAGVENPDAIITGTAYGCLADTILFLTRIIEGKEGMLTPTAFIQSTHNTVGGQIALMLKCHGYNNTFVHRGFSFESALLDATMLLQEKEATHVLAGGIDEITDTSHAILSRFGLYKRSPAGEGAAFFLLSSAPGAGAYAKLDGLTTFYKPKDSEEIGRHIDSFLTRHSTRMKDVDLIITGNNGYGKGDAIYQQAERSVFGDCASIPYKHLCGEYPTSTSFALWLATQIVRSGHLPSGPLSAPRPVSAPVKKILIYNQYVGIHHSLILLSACQ